LSSSPDPARSRVPPIAWQSGEACAARMLPRPWRNYPGITRVLGCQVDSCVVVIRELSIYVGRPCWCELLRESDWPQESPSRRFWLEVGYFYVYVALGIQQQGMLGLP